MSKKALLIGINNYESSPLEGCIKDIDSLGEKLSENSDGSPNMDIKKMPDVKSSGTAMDAIRDLFSGGAEIDIALFYFSGHGYVNDISAQLVFPDDLKSNGYQAGIQMSDILGIATQSKVRNKIIILDCCYAGAIGDNKITQNEATISHGITIMTACRKEEAAAETEEHGLFTELICSALDGAAADYCGNITMSGIYSYIDKALGPWSQRPVFKANISEFVPIRKVEPKVKTNVIRQLTSLFPDKDDTIQLNPSFEFTNNPSIKHEYIKPYAEDEKVSKFKKLQELQSIGFVEPVEEKYMYFAAMHSKQCRLTELGKYYWLLVHKNRLQ